MDEKGDSMGETFEFGLVSYATLDGDITSAAPEDLKENDAYDNFLSFLGMAQHLGIDFIPITWHSALEGARRGRTAEIQQMAIDLQNAFAFKRLSSEQLERRAKDMQALTAELAVLGHPAVRGHPHLPRLEGICWDITPGTEEVWPVLILEKATHGDLMSFMERGPGKALSVTERLGLCSDIAIAIMDMHKNSIIHGDIKPQNVLIFTDASHQFTAKVSDFGHSTIFARPDAIIKMPATEPWVAPEWSHNNATTDPEGARKMDLFSLGALCFWLLFHNNDNNKNTIGHSTSDFLAQRRSGFSLIELADQHIGRTEGLEKEERDKLQLFFEHSLQPDPTLRSSAPNLRNLTYGDVMNLTGPEHTQGHRIPTPLVREADVLEVHHFQVASSVAQLYLADYRVRKFVFKCLKESLQHKHQNQQKTFRVETRAFELALCYKIGLGTDRNERALSALLQETGIRSEDIEEKLDEIQRGPNHRIFRSSLYNEMIENGQDFRVDWLEGYRAERKLETAISWHRRELADLESLFEPANTLTLIVKIELCYALREAGLWDEAIALRIQVTQLMKSTKGERDPDTLGSMSQLAAMYLDRGHWDDAERLLDEVRSIRESTVEAGNPEALETINALAGVYRARGRFENAEEILLPAIKTREKLLGPEHPDTLRLISSLAATYVGQRRLEEAEQMLKRLIEIRKVRLGFKNAFTLANMSNLAAVYYHQDKLEDAKDLYSEVAIVRTDLFGEEHQETLIALSNLASLYKKLGNLEDAERREQQLLQTKIRVFGEDSKSTLTTQGNLALTYAYQERWQDAKELGLKVVDAKRRVIGADYPSTLSSILNLAEAYDELGETEEAKAVLTQGMQDGVAAGRVEQHEVKAIMSMLLSMTEETTGAR